jgi:hypothetical protein
MRAHVRQDAGTVEAVWRWNRVFERGVNLEDPTDGSFVDELLYVVRWRIEAALKAEHDGVRMVAL